MQIAVMNCLTGRYVGMLDKTLYYNWGKVIELKISVLAYSSHSVKVYHRELSKENK